MCKSNFSEALFWPNSRQDSLVTQSCSQFHPSLRFGVNVGRQCDSDGNWSPVDLRNCTMFLDSKPVVIVYFTVTMNSTDVGTAVNITHNVSGCYCTLLNFKIIIRFAATLLSGQVVLSEYHI